MPSNKLSTRRTAARPPVVCRAPPKPPPSPIQLRIWIDTDPVAVDSHTGLRIFACHDGLPAEQPYTADWDPGPGYIDPHPRERNCREGVGVWYAPPYPMLATIKVKVTWTDGSSAFTSLSFQVVEPP